MLGLLFLVVLVGLAVAVWLKRDDLATKGEQRFGDSSPSWQQQERFNGLRERRERLKHSRPPAPVFDPVSLLENDSCEVCSSSPRVQFRNAVSSSMLEFCGHHATRNEPALKAQGFTVTIDGRRV